MATVSMSNNKISLPPTLHSFIIELGERYYSLIDQGNVGFLLEIWLILINERESINNSTIFLKFPMNQLRGSKGITLFKHFFSNLYQSCFSFSQFICSVLQLILFFRKVSKVLILLDIERQLLLLLLRPRDRYSPGVFLTVLH